MKREISLDFSVSSTCMRTRGTVSEDECERETRSPWKVPVLGSPRRWGNHNADYFTLPPKYRPKGLLPSLAKSPTL